MASKITIVDATLVVKSLLPNPELEACQRVLGNLKDTLLAAPAL